MNKQLLRGIECVVLLGLTGTFARMQNARAGGDDAHTAAPTAWGTAYKSYIGNQTLSVGATVRTFGTHPDFRRIAAGGPGRYANIMADELGLDGKPIFRSTGQRVVQEWRDAQGQAIIAPRPYVSGRNGDTAGRLDANAVGAVDSAQSFNQWSAPLKE